MIGALFAKGRSSRLKPGMAARNLAVDLLLAVLQGKRPLDDAFNQMAASVQFRDMEPRDRAFARAIALTALRRTGQIRDVLAQFIDKPPPAPKGALDEILLAATAQLLFMGAPPHAVIDLTVDQIKEDAGARRFSRLANAVLRRVSLQGSALVASQDAEALSTPEWLWLRWVKNYGEDNARRIAAQHLAEAPLDLTVKSDAAGWALRLGGVALPTGSVRFIAKGMIDDLEGYAQGEWWVQDAAAALPTKLFGPLSGLKAADLCAAPGGKTAQLCLAGAAVTAVDHSKGRLRRLLDNLARLGMAADVVEADASSWEPGPVFDAVLLDAPCSATGTIRRNPDIATLKTHADLEALSGLQSRLLDQACAMLKPGGSLVYCTCSLEPEEGEDQIAALLARNPGVRLEPLDAADFPEIAAFITPGGTLRTLPCGLQLSDPDLSGLDGFFAAKIVMQL
ncbi:MAG: RsmB/NOP family class I SAM-dependent RNA methyltransferase [Hyphomicrobiales bacterium]|nr:RsmB/NOP family class I SAM-dependent RNA methyltransferase [Hyphomicrobiales bacterium]